jgi:DNA-binding MarR family transcriptional regulator
LGDRRDEPAVATSGQTTYPAAWHRPGGPVVVALGRRAHDPASAALMLMLGRLTRRHEVMLAASLRGHELDASQFIVLTMLSFQEPPVGMNLARLNQALDMSSGGITKAVSRLAARTLVERISDPADRRSTIIRLTDDGRQVQQSVFSELEKEWSRIFSAVPAERRWLLFESVRELLTILWEDEGYEYE